MKGGKVKFWAAAKAFGLRMWGNVEEAGRDLECGGLTPPWRGLRVGKDGPFANSYPDPSSGRLAHPQSHPRAVSSHRTPDWLPRLLTFIGNFWEPPAVNGLSMCMEHRP